MGCPHPSTPLSLTSALIDKDLVVVGLLFPKLPAGGRQSQPWLDFGRAGPRAPHRGAQEDFHASGGDCGLASSKRAATKRNEIARVILTWRKIQVT